MELYHHGVKGQKWGVRRYQNKDGTLTKEGRERTLFVSGSSKTQFKDNPYYRKSLPKPIKDHLNNYMKTNGRIVVGDAPGVDRQVQNYLKKSGYSNVEVFGPGKKLRYQANKQWKANPIDAPEYEEYSPEWLAKKDIAMEKVSTEGLAVVLENGGAGATRKNVERLINNMKDVKVYELYSDKKKDRWV